MLALKSFSARNFSIKMALPGITRLLGLLDVLKYTTASNYLPMSKMMRLHFQELFVKCI